MEGDLAGVVVEANFELVEDSATSEQIKADSQAFGETDRNGELCATNYNGQIVNENGNKTAIANDYHLSPTVLPVDTHVTGLRGADHAEGR